MAMKREGTEIEEVMERLLDFLAHDLQTEGHRPLKITDIALELEVTPQQLRGPIITLQSGNIIIMP
jgi:hypothetical protein